MAVTGTSTIREIVTDALLDLEYGTLGQAPTAEEMAAGMRYLNRLLKAWQMEGSPMFLRTDGQITLTTAASYALTPARPIRILSARFRQNSIDLPMQEMTQDDYNNLPVKTTQGTPTQFFYDRQKESGTFYVWPVLAAAAGQTIEYTYEREIEDVTDPDAAIDVPSEWYNAVALGLAARMKHMSGNEAAKADIDFKAKDALDTALAGSTEWSFNWRGENG